MHRPDHSTADPDGIDTAVPGYTEGNPLGLPPVPRTIVTKDALNDLTESPCRYVEGAGIPLSKLDYDQMKLAAQAYAALPMFSNWSAKTNDGSYADDFTVALWSGYDFVIAGETGEIQTSPAGHTWTQEASAGTHTQTFRGGCVGGSKVYLCTATGSGGRIDERDAAGGSWSQTFGAIGGEDFYGVAHDGTTLLAVGEDESPGNVPVVLRDATTFDTVTGGLSSQRFVDICIGDGGEFVVLGRTAANGYEVLKYAASAWGVVASGAQTVDRIVWNEAHGLYVLVGANVMLTSPTGVTWTPRAAPFTTGTSASVTQWRHILYATSSTGQAGRSLNGGVTWTRIRHDSTTASGLAVAASDTRLVMAGTGGVISATQQAAF